MAEPPFPLSRDNYSRSPDGIASWVRKGMTRGIKVLSDRADEIGQIGVETVKADIEGSGRVDPNHNADYNGPQSMVDGVDYSVNKATSDETKMSVRVGWDLTQYRHGYPELQDKGFTTADGTTSVIGLQALALGKMRMREAVIKILNEGMK